LNEVVSVIVLSRPTTVYVFYTGRKPFL